MKTPDRKPFVIFANPRTGSTLLTSLLNSHREIICHNEPFNPNGVYAVHRILRSEYMRAYRDADPIRFADFLFSESRPRRVVGFKILAYQNREVSTYLANRRDIKKIVVKRDNMLASYSSNRIANEVKQWTRPKDSSARSTRIEFNPKGFMKWVKEAEDYYSHVENVSEAAGSPVIRLEYDELLDIEVQRNLLEFLEVDPSFEMTSPLKKQNSENLEERFTNWDRVVETLSGTEMEKWLEGGY